MNDTPTWDQHWRSREATRSIEERALYRLRGWLDRHAFEGRWTYCANLKLAKYLQAVAGVDALVSTGPFTSKAIDLKALATSQDAPFESWHHAVLTLDGKVDHDVSKPGWGQYSKADYILSYTLATDKGLLIPLPAWREWLFARSNGPGSMRNWQVCETRDQRKHVQKNNTRVIWCPHSMLIRDIGAIPLHLAQLELWERDSPFRGAAD